MSQSIPLSNCSDVALVDDADYFFLMQWSWRRNNKGYAVRSETHHGKRTFFSMHRVLLNAPRGLYVDHIDNNKLNNTRSNLRLCTQSQNQANRRRHKNNTSGYKGVTRRGNRWHARIWVQQRMIHLGYHDQAYDASMVYDHAARRFFGAFARLNHPDMPQMTYFDGLLDAILAGERPPKPVVPKLKAPAVPKARSKHPGVYWDRGRWRASITRNGRKRHLGYFSSEDEAAQAYARVRSELPVPD